MKVEVSVKNIIRETSIVMDGDRVLIMKVLKFLEDTVHEEDGKFELK